MIFAVVLTISPAFHIPPPGTGLPTWFETTWLMYLPPLIDTASFVEIWLASNSKSSPHNIALQYGKILFSIIGLIYLYLLGFKALNKLALNPPILFL